MGKYIVINADRGRPQALGFYETLEEAQQDAFSRACKNQNPMEVFELVGRMTPPEMSLAPEDYWTTE